MLLRSGVGCFFRERMSGQGDGEYGPASNDEVDSEKQTDRPSGRTRQAFQDQSPQHECEDAACEQPAPVRDRVQLESENDFEDAAGKEEDR